LLQPSSAQQRQQKTLLLLFRFFSPRYPTSNSNYLCYATGYHRSISCSSLSDSCESVLSTFAQNGNYPNRSRAHFHSSFFLTLLFPSSSLPPLTFTLNIIDKVKYTHGIYSDDWIWKRGVIWWWWCED
jgi:hypothetical protein